MRTSRKMALLTSLYFAQGLPFGFFQQALPVLMRRRGVSLEHIGLGYLLALPWALKFLWAPFVDQWGAPGQRAGRRRAVILPLQLATVALMVLLGLGAAHLGLAALLVGVFLANLLAATQDIATDGLAVDLLADQERGLGNGVQVAGYRVGMITGGGLLLIYLERLDRLRPGSAFLLMAALLLLATAPVAWFREPARAAPPLRYGALLSDFLRRPGAAPWMALLLLYKFGESMANGMVRPFLVDRGLREADIGRMLGVWGFSAGLCGSLLGGALVNRLGRRGALLAFAGVQALSVGGYLLLSLTPPGGRAALTALCAFEYLGSGLATAALFTAMMDVCRGESGGSDYTVQASAVVVATLGGAALSGYVAEAAGFPALFALAAALCLAAAASVPYLGRAYPRLLQSVHPMGQSSG